MINTLIWYYYFIVRSGVMEIKGFTIFFKTEDDVEKIKKHLEGISKGYQSKKRNG